MIQRLAQKTWEASRKESRIARTVVLKLKTSDFKIRTRSHTPALRLVPPRSSPKVDLSLRERVARAPQHRFRLVGVGLRNFIESQEFLASAVSFRVTRASRFPLPLLSLISCACTGTPLCHSRTRVTPVACRTGAR
jgi:hypothetical protein